MSQWFLSRQGQSVGPFSNEQLRDMAAQGQLAPDEQVWAGHTKKWVPARAIAGVFATTAAPIAQGILESPKSARQPGRAGLRQRPAPAIPRGADATPLARTPAPVGIASGAPPQLAASAAQQAPVAEPSFLQKLRGLPKPILFGLFGAAGGLLGALFFGELLWFLLQPPQHKAALVPPLQMAVAPSLHIFNGGKNRFTVKIARHGFDGPVELAAAAHAPAGVTVLPILMNDDKDSAEVEVEVHPSVLSGTYQVPFVAKGPPEKGSPTAAATLELVVKTAPPPLSLRVPPQVQAYPGSKNQFQVKIARNNFDGPVKIDAVDLPPGVNVAPITLDPDQKEIKAAVQVDKSALPATVKLQLRAKGPNDEAANASLDLVIKPPPPFLSMGVPPEVKVYQGGKAQFQTKVSRSPASAPVSLSFKGAPAGVTLKDVKITPDRDEVAVEMSAAKETPPGITDVTVQGVIKPEGGADMITEEKFKLEVAILPEPKADVLFVLDLTGSMGFAIQGIKQGLAKFADNLKKSKIDVRIGFLGFRDIEDDHKNKNAFTVLVNGMIVNKDYVEFEQLLQSEKLDLFTRDFDKFAELVGKLNASGGGDDPESSPLALVHASKQMFRRDASKVVVLITDAPPKLIHFEKPTESIADAIKALQDAGIDQFHLVAKEEDLKNPVKEKAYQPLLDAFQNNSFSDIKKNSNADAFAALLPKLSEEISKITIAKPPSASQGAPAPPPPPPAGDLTTANAPPPASAADLPPAPTTPDVSLKAVQSTQGYAREDSPRLLAAIGIWTAAIAVAICLFLIAGQLFYSRKAWMNAPDFFKGCAGGLTAGLLGGVIGQVLFQLTAGGTAWDIVSRTFGWGLLGALIGGGMSLIVPNLKWHRGLEGGLAGGIVGALGFMLVSLLMGELGGRLLGAAILGFFIGVMIALAEMVFRRYWLELTFSAREVRTITLGTAAIGIGGDERQASVFVQGSAPLALRYRVEGERVLCQDMATGQVFEVPPGDRRQVGNVTIAVCSPASARTIGLALQLSTGKTLPLGEGMPLTADDVTGLEPQGTDGTVALISRRPNDPRTMLLRNRSKQTWAIQDPTGKQSPIEPGRAIELGLNLLINFGQVQGKLVAEEAPR